MTGDRGRSRQRLAGSDYTKLRLRREASAVKQKNASSNAENQTVGRWKQN